MATILGRLRICRLASQVSRAASSPRLRSVAATIIANAGERRTDGGASEADPDLHTEVSRQDESLGKDTANIRRVDIGALGCSTPATFPRPIVEQCLRRVMQVKKKREGFRPP